MARIGRRDILWSVNKSVCAVTTLARACDRRLVRFLQSQHEWLQVVMLETLQNSGNWILSFLRFYRRLRRLQVDIRRNLLHSRKSKFWFDVQEADGSLTQFKRVRSHIHGSCFTHGRHFLLVPTGFGCWYYALVTHTGGTEKPDAMCSQCEMSPKTRTKLNPPLLKEICLREIDHVDPNRKLSHHGVPTYIFEDKQLKKQISKGRSPTMRHGSRTHSYLTQLILTPHVSEIRRYQKPICRTCDRMNIHSCWPETLLPSFSCSTSWTLLCSLVANAADQGGREGEDDNPVVAKSRLARDIVSLVPEFEYPPC